MASVLPEPAQATTCRRESVDCTTARCSRESSNCGAVELKAGSIGNGTPGLETPGNMLTLTVQRGGRQVQVPIVLGSEQ
ncbi:MAG: hypothetical protein ACRD1L_07140 [Terriglobales bacterium]